ncbi:hypothetical protein TNCV_31811 [Trichonephila clavipes]|nr:hypothetical protein TNCV_31811 [Trichonephila clavipes]
MASVFSKHESNRAHLGRSRKTSCWPSTTPINPPRTGKSSSGRKPTQETIPSQLHSGREDCRMLTSTDVFVLTPRHTFILSGCQLWTLIHPRRTIRHVFSDD